MKITYVTVLGGKRGTREANTKGGFSTLPRVGETMKFKVLGPEAEVEAVVRDVVRFVPSRHHDQDLDKAAEVLVAPFSEGVDADHERRLIARFELVGFHFA